MSFATECYTINANYRIMRFGLTVNMSFLTNLKED